MTKPLTYDAIYAEEILPAIAIDHSSLITRINKAFETTYGWTKKDLLGKSITEIIPPYLRDAHQIGFSRFLTTEQPTLLGVTLPLEMLYKDGTIQPAEHYIVGEKKEARWRFAATIVAKS